jgi:hypothetical protein
MARYRFPQCARAENIVIRLTTKYPGRNSPLELDLNSNRKRRRGGAEPGRRAIRSADRAGAAPPQRERQFNLDDMLRRGNRAISKGFMRLTHGNVRAAVLGIPHTVLAHGTADKK